MDGHTRDAISHFQALMVSLQMRYAVHTNCGGLVGEDGQCRSCRAFSADRHYVLLPTERGTLTEALRALEGLVTAWNKATKEAVCSEAALHACFADLPALPRGIRGLSLLDLAGDVSAKYLALHATTNTQHEALQKMADRLAVSDATIANLEREMERRQQVADASAQSVREERAVDSVVIDSLKREVEMLRTELTAQKEEPRDGDAVISKAVAGRDSKIAEAEAEIERLRATVRLQDEALHSAEERSKQLCQQIGLIQEALATYTAREARLHEEELLDLVGQANDLEERLKHIESDENVEVVRGILNGRIHSAWHAETVEERQRQLVLAATVLHYWIRLTERRGL